MDIQRILDRYDRLMDEKEFDQAGSHLSYWIAEAESTGDDRSAFTLLNELVGFYRMRGKKEETITAIEKLLKHTEKMDLADTVSGATAYINAATGYKSADMPKAALPLYRKAQEIYERDLEAGDRRLPALYNNMALTLMALGDHEEAYATFNKALAILQTSENSENEQAITLLNLADLAQASLPQEEADEKTAEYAERAKALLDTSFENKRDGFKFTAEKCIPAFKYHGYFLAAGDLEEKIKEINRC